MTLALAVSYALAIVFWLFTAVYGLLASRPFIVEQFLGPRLFPPLAWFADHWVIASMVILGLWAAPRARGGWRARAAAGLWLVACTAWPLAAARSHPEGSPPSCSVLSLSLSRSSLSYSP